MAKDKVKEKKKAKAVDKNDVKSGKKPGRREQAASSKKLIKSKGPEFKKNNKTASRTTDFTVDDFKEAPYNPRYISPVELQRLGKSMTTYGDLSGIVFNRHSGVTISGHQRLKQVRLYEHGTVLKDVKDDGYGTVAEGYVWYKGPNGKVRIPLRVVDWSDKKAEFAANIAANAHGGSFDNKLLANLVEAIEPGDGEFDIDLLGIDPITIKTLPYEDKIGDANKETSPSGSGPSFAEFNSESFDGELVHECPRCSMRFNDNGEEVVRKGYSEPEDDDEEDEKPSKKKSKSKKDKDKPLKKGAKELAEFSTPAKKKPKKKSK
jgi:hypothetical protein